MFDFLLFSKKNDSANPIENVKILCKILNRVSGSKIFKSVSGSGSTFRVRVPGFGFKNFPIGFRVRV